MAEKSADQTNCIIHTSNSYVYLYDFLFNNTITDEIQASTFLVLQNNPFTYIQYGLFAPHSNMDSCFKAENSLQIQLMSVAFQASDWKSGTLMDLTASQIIANHICKTNNEEIKYANDALTDSVIILIDSNFTEECDVDDIKAPTVPPATELTEAQEVAAIVTLVFFIVFFVIVFATLISLVFCKVGLSEELTFSENHSFEEDSFESFAN